MTSILRFLRLWRILPIPLSIAIFLTLLYIVNFLKPLFYPTINRASFPRRMTIHIIDPYIDFILLILSIMATVSILLVLLNHKRRVILLILALILIYCLASSSYLFLCFPLILAVFFVLIPGGLRIAVAKGSLAVFMVLIIAVEVLALIGWLLLPLSPKPYDLLENPYPWIEAKLFYLASLPQPVIASMFMLTPIIYLVIKYFLTLPTYTGLKIKPPYYLPIASTVLSIFLAYYPYIPSINPSGKPVGVDIEWIYVPIFEELMGMEFREALVRASTVLFGRPFFFIPLYILLLATRLPPILVTKFLPLALAPLYVLSVYLSVKILTRDSFTASISSFIAATSLFFTVGMFSGQLANWLAFIFIQPSIALLIEAVRLESYRKALYSTILSIVAMYTHAHLWAVYFASIAIYTVMRRRGVKIIALWLSINIVMDLFKTYILNTSGGVRGDVEIASSSWSIDNLYSFWIINNHLFRYFYAGYLAMPLLYILAIVGLISIKESYGELFRVLVAISTPIYFASPEPLQARVLLSLPLDILASIGLTLILGKCGRNKCIIITILTFLIFINYSLRALAGMVVVS